MGKLANISNKKTVFYSMNTHIMSIFNLDCFRANKVVLSWISICFHEYVKSFPT